jgi:hypothetical protein
MSAWSVWLEFLRPDHGHEEVEEERKGDQPHDDVFHKGAGSEVGAEAHVEGTSDEEGGGDAEVEEVAHEECSRHQPLLTN